MKPCWYAKLNEILSVFQLQSVEDFTTLWFFKVYFGQYFDEDCTLVLKKLKILNHSWLIYEGNKKWIFIYVIDFLFLPTA